MDADGGEIARYQQLIQLSCTGDRLDEDDDLIELERVEEFVQLAVLLVLIELDVVLL